jgi:hypothetical protein
MLEDIIRTYQRIGYSYLDTRRGNTAHVVGQNHVGTLFVGKSLPEHIRDDEARSGHLFIGQARDDTAHLVEQGVNLLGIKFTILRTLSGGPNDLWGVDGAETAMTHPRHQPELMQDTQGRSPLCVKGNVPEQRTMTFCRRISDKLWHQWYTTIPMKPGLLILRLALVPLPRSSG